MFRFVALFLTKLTHLTQFWAKTAGVVRARDAKAHGRGIYRFFTSELNEAAQLRHMLLHYQPQLSLTSQQVTGVEALLRWEHPKHGIISPTLFIPLLEELGLITEVGQWVLQTACRENVKWQGAGLPPVRTAVNISAQQFYRGNILQMVADVLKESGLDPRWLELELTESLTLDASETTDHLPRDRVVIPNGPHPASGEMTIERHCHADYWNPGRGSAIAYIDSAKRPYEPWSEGPAQLFVS